MEFMLIMFFEDGTAADPSIFADMGRFAGGLAAQGKLVGGAPLKDDGGGTRIRQSGTELLVTDGPFAETKESVAGYFIVECEGRDEAVAIAKGCPHAKIGPVEVREVIKIGG